MTSISLRVLLSTALALLACACATTSAPGATASATPPPVTVADDAAPPQTRADMAAAAAAAAPRELDPPVKPLTPLERATVQYRVMAGELAAGRKQPEVAAYAFLEALKIVDDVELAQRATSMALAAHNEGLSLAAAQRWHELAPNEADPREVIARISLNQGQLAETYTQLEAIVSGDAGGPDEGLHHAAMILVLAGPDRAEGALAVMQQLVAKWPALAAAHHSLGLLALRFGQLDLADKAAHEALRLEPVSRDHSLLLAGVLVRQNKLDDANAIIEGMLKTEKNPAELRLGYAKLLLESNQRDAARAQLQRTLEAAPGNADARYALGVLAYNDRNFDEAEKYFLPLLQTARADEASFQLGRLEEARKNYNKAMAYYERVDTGQQAIEAAVRRAAVMTETGQIKPARELMQDLREQYPQLADRFFVAEGEMLGNAGAFDDALSLYQTALKQMPDNNDLLYGRSLVYERQQKINLAEQDLRSILKNDADDARSMNALGYMLVVHTQRLEEASKLIAHALELQPDDAAIIDSMGWVQFKLGHKDQARSLLQKAFEKFPDPEVAAHLGEVLWSLGEKDQARSVWQKGLAGDPNHAVLKETVQRLTQ